MTIKAAAKSCTKTALNISSQTYRQLTSQIRLLPDFLIIGGQRCGTSSLYYYLTDHPGVIPACTKEIHFFDESFHKDLQWYRAQFPTTLQKYYTQQALKRTFITGEASPYYLFYPHAPQRIARVMPGVKLIVLLRNPIDRAYSQHWLEVEGGYETLSFKDAIESEPRRIAGELERMMEDENYQSIKYRRFSYLTRGIYIDQIQQWMSIFPREQFLILRSEDLYSDPARTLKQTLEFLGMPEQEIETTREYKKYKLPLPKGYKIKYKYRPPKLDPSLREELIAYFKPYNERLSNFLGRDFGWN